MKKIYIYKLDSEDLDLNIDEIDSKFSVKKWSPGLTRFLPPNSSYKYILFWVAHYLSLFNSGKYCAYMTYYNSQLISSLVCIPALFKWKFMAPGDIQIKDVFTHKNHRGKGHGYKLVVRAIRDLKKIDRAFWYMTNEDNVPSQKLCKKIGFKYKGEYKRHRNKFFVYTGDIVRENGLRE